MLLYKETRLSDFIDSMLSFYFMFLKEFEINGNGVSACLHACDIQQIQSISSRI